VYEVWTNIAQTCFNLLRIWEELYESSVNDVIVNYPHLQSKVSFFIMKGSLYERIFFTILGRNLYKTCMNIVYVL
jgi:hypothetical protein